MTNTIEPGAEKLTFGDRFDEISRRMDDAYAERRKCEPGTVEYVKADEAIEAVYADLRVLNAATREHIHGKVEG